MDAEIRALERQFASGDPQAQARLNAALCRSGRHDFRSNRLCSRCKAAYYHPKNPTGRLWDALLAGEGHGAVGWKNGYFLGGAYGTYTGLPSLGRKDKSLILQFRDPTAWKPYSPMSMSYAKVFPRDQWDPPYELIPWEKRSDKLSVRFNQGQVDGQTKYEWRVLPKTAKELADMLVWEPFCTTCSGNGYLTSYPIHDEVTISPCTTCKLPLAVEHCLGTP